MAKHSNPEHFNVVGDKKVTVTVTFGVADGAGDKLAMKIAQDYLGYYAASGIHKSFGYEIEVKHDKG